VVTRNDGLLSPAARRFLEIVAERADDGCKASGAVRGR